jgi:transposase InsO family protein
MKKHKMSFNVNVMSKVLKVDRASYYHWVKMGCVIEKVDEQLNRLIKSIFEEGRRLYGTRRVQDKLVNSYGVIVSRQRISGIMKHLGLSVKHKKKFKNTTDSKHNLPIAPNLLNREFEASIPDTKYVGDITYISTKQGWLYLATVIDLYSRKIVGWSMDDTMQTTLVNNALLMAIRHRNPPKGLLWHTDRGSQYASTDHRKLCQKYEITQSMSRKGNCWDNAVAESFFHTLKTELVYQTTYETKAEANQSIFEYIEIYYNRKRMHSANNYLSPVDYEQKMLLSEIAA